MRLIAAAVCTPLAFVCVNLLAQYAIYVWTSMSFASTTSQMEVLPYIASRMEASPLGISLDRGPLVVSAAAALACLAGTLLAEPRDPELHVKKSEVFGRQRFSTVAERRVYAHTEATADHPRPEWCERVEDDNVILSANSEISATRIPRSENVRGLDLEGQLSNRHVFLTAGSGAGKSYRFVGPMVMQLLGNYVFTDPSGELFRRYAGFLEAHGYTVHVINLMDAAHIRASTGINLVMQCRDLPELNLMISTFIENTKGENTAGDQQFFINMERSFYTCSCGLQRYWFAKTSGPSDCSLPSLIDFLEMTKQMGTDGITQLDYIFDGTLGDERYRFPGFAQYIIDTHGGDPAALDDDTLEENAIRKAYHTFKANAGAPEQMAAVISSCAARLQRLNDPAIRNLLERDEFDLHGIDERKTAVFLCVNDGGGPYDFVAGMAISMLLDAAQKKARSNPDGHLKIPLWFVLDEVRNIGKINKLPEAFATVRKYWINLVAVVQHSRALKEVYGEAADSIKGNCAVFEYLGSGTFEDCEQMSKEMGYYTAMSDSGSQTKSSSGKSVTVSDKENKIALMSPEEIYNYDPVTDTGLGPHRCLTHYKNGMWFRDEKYDPTTHPRYAEVERIGPTDQIAWAEVKRPTPTVTFDGEEAGEGVHVLVGEA